MKLAILFSAAAVAASAADKRFPIELPLLSITNRGIVYEMPIQITGMDIDGIIIFSGLKGGRIPFEEIPKEMHAFLLGDSNAVSAVSNLVALRAELKQAKTEENLARRIEQAKAARRIAAVKAMDERAIFLNGRVLQRLDEGFLFVSREDPPAAVSSTLNGTCYVEKCAQNESWLDDDKATAWGYPLGTFEYISVNNSRKTVRRVTMDRSYAISLAISGLE